ncbi:MAG: tRNA (adenosine(37)-N6)-dimethylallyltransferase MiaA [Acidobacteriota bacterium]
MIERPLLIVVGPTAAGKTWLGAQLALRFHGEVVSADAFAVYRGMDIGTAKPEPELRKLVPHHLLDVASPTERYSAGQFLRDADSVIAEIDRRGRQPVVVGGTLFYVHALLYGLFPEPPKDLTLRAELEAAWERDPEALRRDLAQRDPELFARLSPNDRQRILRALEVSMLAGRPMSELWAQSPSSGPRYRFCLLACCPPRPALHARIAARVETMFARGLVDETRRLLESGVAPTAHALKAIGYREAVRVVQGEWSETQARQATVVATRQLAKRQLTWLRGEAGVQWLSGFGEDVLEQASALWEACRGE